MRILVALFSAAVSAGTDDCTLAGCIPKDLSDVVNAALGAKNSGNAKLNSTGTSTNTTSAFVSPLGLTVNECASLLAERLRSFSNFKTATENIWDDMTSLQKALSSVEKVSTDIGLVETGFASQLEQTQEMFSKATDQVTSLNTWLTGEKVIRAQLSELYTALDEKVIKTSKYVLLNSSSVRDKLFEMQKIHDHATRILTAVGDAETLMYQWAYNVSQTANRHTVNLVTVTQTLNYRANQVNSVKESNTQLNSIVTQLTQKYGQDKIKELSKLFDEQQPPVPVAPTTTAPSEESSTSPLSS